MNIQTFTVTGSGTWTKPSDAVANDWAEIIMVGAGGGGGSGRNGASGTARFGGGGGGGGGVLVTKMRVSDMPSTISLFVGVGGTGGGAVVTANTNGANGGLGGSSFLDFTSLGTGYVYAKGGSGGEGGTAAAGTGAAAIAGGISINGVVLDTSTGGNGSQTATNAGGSLPILWATTGGAGGTGQSTSNVSADAGDGGSLGGDGTIKVEGGSGGLTNPGAVGSAPLAANLMFAYGLGGGGGRGGASTTAGGNGGNGGGYGGGGGGGGGSGANSGSGAGGNGANGFIQIITPTTESATTSSGVTRSRTI